MAILTLELGKVEDLSLIKEIAGVLKNGGIAVIPTDTIYGIVGHAASKIAVERIYKLRRRTSSKPMIILAASVEQIADLGTKVTSKQKAIFKKLWPNPVSIVLDCPSRKLSYLHRGKKSLAFRIPNNEFLLSLLKLSGPLVAPSANFEGGKPAINIEEAKNYFKDSVPLYVDTGQLNSPPSTVVKLEKNKFILLRQGAAKIPKNLLK